MFLNEILFKFTFKMSEFLLLNEQSAFFINFKRILILLKALNPKIPKTLQPQVCMGLSQDPPPPIFGLQTRINVSFS